MTGHDADLTSVGRDDSRAVGADQSRLFLTQKMPLDFRHVLLGDALRDANH